MIGTGSKQAFTFGEKNPRRALDWYMKAAPASFQTVIKDPFVVGAVIDFGNLDLLEAESITVVKEACRCQQCGDSANGLGANL